MHRLMVKLTVLPVYLRVLSWATRPLTVVLPCKWNILMCCFLASYFIGQRSILQRRQLANHVGYCSKGHYRRAEVIDCVMTPDDFYDLYLNALLKHMANSIYNQSENNTIVSGKLFDV